MLEPKTPLPWVTATGTRYMGPQDAAYAVHAANVLPEVVAALQQLQGKAEDDVRRAVKAEDPDAIASEHHWLWFIDAALAKAEGAPEGDRG